MRDSRLILALSGLALLAASRRPGPPIRYVALGDSLTAGIGAFYGFGFADHVARLLRRLGRPVRYVNLGRIRMTSPGLLRALDQSESLRDEIRGAEVITLCIGGNDLLRCRENPDCLEAAAARFPAHWRAAVERIRALNPGATLVAVTLYNPYPAGHPKREQAERFIEAINRTIRDPDLARAHRLVVAEACAAIDGREPTRTWVLLGDIHPNGIGHRAVAREIYRCVASACRPDPNPEPGSSRPLTG
ncbi:SGNH/GDSL hydrolase family protein [Caldinitratiruptor microaerophilus]|uniref:SGNH hydrolase-type esterase domain-containing protein n=1 Tax=Caldinitratiruptor microaerophilus TaxID=671077 RepID=A0AA35CK76_9FIRM|nr:SGNH/GDSL hydrolase family protein [Caldinitratiruptor microaerophilus]BDG60024.1 hypothetical protein caldi_11140 [Caldinitratiruptor microaerophilus]